MIRVSASEFARHFGRYRDLVQREPIEITSREGPSGYLISEAEFAYFNKLKARTRQVYRVHELPADVIDQLVNARMDPKHDHLNALLDSTDFDDDPAA